MRTVLILIILILTSSCQSLSTRTIQKHRAIVPTDIEADPDDTQPLVSTQTIHKHRAVILTDIEADPDDTQSLVRLLLYSNQIDIKGLVATTSCWHRDIVNPESIRKVIHAYGKIHPNLINHEAGFPEAESLLALLRENQPHD